MVIRLDDALATVVPHEWGRGYVVQVTLVVVFVIRCLFYKPTGQHGNKIE